MTRVESGLDYRRREEELGEPTTQVFTCRTMSSEDDEPQIEAASTDSPDSKDSWVRSPQKLDEEKKQTQDAQSPKNNHQELSPLQTQTPNDLETNSEDETGTKEAPETMQNGSLSEKVENEKSDKAATGFQTSEEVVNAVIPMDQTERSCNLTSDHSTQTASTKDFIEDKPFCETTDVSEGDVTTPMNVEGIPEDDDDDDFGDFEEATEPTKQSDDGFGDFDEGKDPAGSANLSSSSSFVPMDDATRAADSLLKLRGVDFASAVSKAFQGFASDKSRSTGGLGELTIVRNLKLTACTESRFGAHLLYPRPVPAGFLRTSGIPVLLSSQITTAEQRLLHRLGMQEAYARAQKEEMLVSQTTSFESTSQASASPTPSRELGSEVQSANDDANLDLDFLVNYSSQPLNASAGSSNGAESARCEELTRHSNLHDLFVGIVESSQSSAFSLSSGLSDHKHDDNQLPTPTLLPQSLREPCLKEDDWDGFVDATEAQMESSSTNNSKSKDVSNEWDEFKETDSASAKQKDKEMTGENDIFSGEWLSQLRSSREVADADLPVAPSVECSKPADLLESDWGTFTDAPSNQAVSSNDKIHQLPYSHGRLVKEPQPFVPVLKTDSSDQWTSLNSLAFGQVTLLEPAAQLLEEEEWGGFQG